MNKTKMPDGFVMPDPFIPFGAYKKKDGKYSWIDGSELAIGAPNHWQEGQPDGKDGDGPESQKCIGFNVMSNDVGFGDIKCNGRYLYVCQLEDSEVTENPNAQSKDATPTGVQKPCPDNTWAMVGNTCLKIPDNPLMSIVDGLTTCTKVNSQSNIARFFIKAEYEMFIRYISTNVTSQAQHAYVALGFQRANGAQFVTSNGAAVAYTHWALKQPAADGGDCITVNDVSGFTWKVTDCKSTAFIVCQIDARTFASTTSEGKSNEAPKSEAKDTSKKNDCCKSRYSMNLRMIINEASRYPTAAFPEEVFLGNQEYQDFRRNPGQLTKVISDRLTLSSFLGGFDNASEFDISNITTNFRGYCNYATILKSRLEFYARVDEDQSSLLIYLAKNCEMNSTIEDLSIILDNWILIKDLKIEPPKFLDNQFDTMSKIKDQYETLCLRDSKCSDLVVGHLNSELKSLISYSEPGSLILNVLDCETFLIWIKYMNLNFTCGSIYGILIEFSTNGVIMLSINEHYFKNDSVMISESYCSSQCVDQIFRTPKLDYTLCNGAFSNFYKFIIYINLIVICKIYQEY
uniref:C-type lectin domain-containing protein n=1 Tax=Romanomermis culicivorax TaxID=13658 RepID=A0A915I5M7_ROMCU